MLPGELTIVEQVLLNRGFELEDIEHYLNTTDNDILDPNLLDNMKNGLSMLTKHISNNDKIMIQVDSDCDGMTSAAVLINYLHSFFPQYVENNIYYRLHEGKQHGIILETVPKDVKLVIAPDSSSNDYEVHAALAERGVDVLVIDHHEAEKVSENACIINNQLCDYPNKSLSGVGVVYKFCSYIDSMLGRDEADQFLDLVALGMIADMVDLRTFETRHLIKIGLENIRNPFFKTMVEKQAFSLKDEITPVGIAFYIAPYVNAMMRMGSQSEKLCLFESMLNHKAYQPIPSTKRGCAGQVEPRVEQACRNCTNVKNKQTKARDNMLEIIEHVIEKNHLLSNKLLIIPLSGFDVDRNLTGLIANQLMAKYQRPVLLLNKTENGWEGSGRGCEKSELSDFREFLSKSGWTQYSEGHANAFGVGIDEDKLQDLIYYSNKELADIEFNPNYKVDFIFQAYGFGPSDIISISDLKPIWGQNIKEALVAVEGINITKDNLVLMSRDKNPTLKINLPYGMSMIKFKSSEEEFEKLYSETGCITINAICRCEKNVWNGKVSAQLLIDDYEIIKEQKYYF